MTHLVKSNQMFWQDYLQKSRGIHSHFPSSTVKHFPFTWAQSRRSPQGLLPQELRPRFWNKSAPSAVICMGWTDPGLLASKPPGNQPELQYVSAEFTGVSVWPSKQIETHVRNVCCSLPSWCQERIDSLLKYVSTIPYWFWETRQTGICCKYLQLKWYSSKWIRWDKYWDLQYSRLTRPKNKEHFRGNSVPNFKLCHVLIFSNSYPHN